MSSTTVRQATAARVALHLIRTGGVTTPAQELSRNGEVIPIVRASVEEALAPADLRKLAEHTGGTTAFYQHADRPLEFLDRITRFQYLLGYYPTSVALAVFLDDANGKVLGEKRERVELKFNAKEFARIKREWLAFNVAIKVPGHPTHARVIVYEYESNRLLYESATLPRARSR